VGLSLVRIASLHCSSASPHREINGSVNNTQYNVLMVSLRGVFLKPISSI
jgi:hypothetical protein